MSINDKLRNAKATEWPAEDMTEAEIKSLVELAKISAMIERRRLDMKMTQSQFADYMGVTQSMVSKWESRAYNFTIKSLNEICLKLGGTFSVSLDFDGGSDDCKVCPIEKAVTKKSSTVGTQIFDIAGI